MTSIARAVEGGDLLECTSKSSASTGFESGIEHTTDPFSLPMLSTSGVPLTSSSTVVSFVVFKLSRSCSCNGCACVSSEPCTDRHCHTNRNIPGILPNPNISLQTTSSLLGSICSNNTATNGTVIKPNPCVLNVNTTRCNLLLSSCT